MQESVENWSYYIKQDKYCMFSFIKVCLNKPRDRQTDRHDLKEEGGCLGRGRGPVDKGKEQQMAAGKVSSKYTTKV